MILISQQTQDVESMLFYHLVHRLRCWTNVEPESYDVGPTLNQHWFNVLYLLGYLFDPCSGYSCNAIGFLGKRKIWFHVLNQANYLFRIRCQWTRLGGESPSGSGTYSSIIVLNELEIPARYNDVQNQKAVSAHSTSEQILPFGFAERCNDVTCHCDKINMSHPWKVVDHSVSRGLNRHIWHFMKWQTWPFNPQGERYVWHNSGDLKVCLLLLFPFKSFLSLSNSTFQRGQRLQIVFRRCPH